MASQLYACGLAGVIGEAGAVQARNPILMAQIIACSSATLPMGMLNCALGRSIKERELPVLKRRSDQTAVVHLATAEPPPLSEDLH
jgi:hypothetical protein